MSRSTSSSPVMTPAVSPTGRNDFARIRPMIDWNNNAAR